MPTGRIGFVKCANLCEPDLIFSGQLLVAVMKRFIILLYIFSVQILKSNNSKKVKFENPTKPARAFEKIQPIYL
jgi:hypothetical protein